jgi:hypothetical protein
MRYGDLTALTTFFPHMSPSRDGVDDGVMGDITMRYPYRGIEERKRGSERSAGDESGEIMKAIQPFKRRGAMSWCK